MKNNTQRTNQQRFAYWRAVVFLSLMVTVLSACKDERLIGLEVQPEGYLDPIQYVDTFTVEAFTFLAEPQRSSRYQNFVGKMHNDVFGKTEAALFLNFSLESENVYLDLPASSYTVDSLVFTVWPMNAYGDPSPDMTIDVFVVDEDMIIDSSYTSNRDFRVDDYPVGSRTISYPSPEAITDQIEDTASNYTGLHFRLDDDLGTYLLQGIGTAYSSSSEFREYFKGLALKVSSDPGMNSGAIYNLMVSTGNTGLKLYYHYTDEQEGEIVYTQINFEVVGTNMRYNKFSHDYSNSMVEEYLTLPDTDHDYLFVQGMSGAKVRVNLPYIVNYLRMTDLAISKASISFEASELQPSDLDLAGQLYFLDYEVDRRDGDTNETLTPDYGFSPARHGGKYDAATGSYTFDITRQIQKIKEEDQQGNDINLGFTLNAQLPVINGNVRNQTVLKGSDNIKLKIFYTDISD